MIAQRFGVTPATVRRLLAQLDGASSSDVAALRAGKVNLAIHAVVARHVETDERPGILDAIGKISIKTRELDALFVALGWNALIELGSSHRDQRLLLFTWACSVLEELPQKSTKDRLRQLALQFPFKFERHGSSSTLVAQ